MLIKWYELKARLELDACFTKETLVPERDTLNSFTRSCMNVLSTEKFLGPTEDVLGTITVSSKRGGLDEAVRSNSLGVD